MFSRKILIGLVIIFKSRPPRFPQLSLAWDHVWGSPTKSKQTFLKTNSHIIGKLLPGQASDFSGEDRNPTEIHTKTAVWSNVPMVTVIYRAKTHSAEGSVAETSTE